MFDVIQAAALDISKVFCRVLHACLVYKRRSHGNFMHVFSHIFSYFRTRLLYVVLQVLTYGFEVLLLKFLSLISSFTTLCWVNKEVNLESDKVFQPIRAMLFL